MEDRTITINSISKTYSVTGWRVGWAIAEKKLTERIRKVHDFLTVGAPTPFQHAAVTALAFPEQYYLDLQAHYYEARGFLFNILLETGFKPYLPKGAYYIIADTTNLMDKLNVNDDFTFSKRLIELTGVATVPGSSFYSRPEAGRQQVRFSFCKKWETLNAVKESLIKLLS
jgi:aminotransferase